MKVKTKTFKIKENLLPLFLFVFIFLFVSSYTFNANINSDGANNAVLAKEIVKSQNLLQHQPYRIAEITNEEIVYYPISYSQFSHVFMALFYLIGGETGFKLFSPFLAMVTAFFVYIFLREINQVVAVLSSILVTIIGSFRFVSMTPLMEQYLLPMVIASVCFYSLYIKTNKKRYVLLTGLFLGITFVIKQQGVLFAGLMLPSIFFIHLYNSRNLKKISELKVFMIILLIFVTISAIPTLEQIGRNGTIDFVPSNSIRIPFLHPKYFVNQEAKNMIINWISPQYWFIYESPFQVFKAYLLYPLFYVNAPSFFDMRGLVISFTLFLLGTIFIIKRNKRIGLILSSVFLLEVFTLYLMNTPIQNYHVIGLAILSIFLSSGIYYFCKLIPNKKILIPLFSLVLIVLLVPSYVIYIHQPIFGHSRRINDEHLKSLESLSSFVETNIPENTIILGPDGEYRYWIERDFIWISDMGGIKISELLTTRDEENAIKILKEYNISYIFIDNDQIKRYGLGDYIPPDGLLMIIDHSCYFKKEYDDGVLRLYKVYIKT